MKIGIAAWCLHQRGPNALFEAKSLGLEAVHVDPGESSSETFLGSPKNLETYRRIIEETNIVITGLACNILDRHHISQMQDYIFEVIDLADRIRVPLVYIPSFDVNEIRNASDLVGTARILKACCDYVGGRSIEVASENTLGVEDNLHLLNAVDHEKMRIMIDTYNPIIWGHRAVNLITELWPYLCDQVHVKDGTNNTMGNARLGEGDAEFAEVVRALKGHGFDGTLIIENEYSPSHIGTQIQHDIVQIELLFGQKGG